MNRGVVAICSALFCGPIKKASGSALLYFDVGECWSLKPEKPDIQKKALC